MTKGRNIRKLLDGTRGFHAFRRYRNTFLRQQHCPDGLLKFWMGHSAVGMSDLYDRSREDVQYRRDVAKAMGIGFELPKTLAPISDANGRQTETLKSEVALAERQ